ncbi:MAG: hypothetical protein IJG00_01080 [Clostridia bacterium]|nr:hypothetical protein [Clostridia bacterium]
MKEDFKYEIWNLPSYITELESRENLTDKDLENISGGTMNRKLAASVLAGLSAFTIAPGIVSPVVSAVTTTKSSSQREIKNQNVNFEITKEQAIEDINYAIKAIKDNHVSAVEKVPDEVTNQAKIEIENLKDKVSVIDEWRAISRIFSKLHDAHTMVLSPDFLNKRLPFDTEYENGKFICKSGDFKDCEITAINDIPIDELYKIFQNHYSYEIEERTVHSFFETPSNFIPEGKFALCGIDTSKPIKVSFNTQSGVQSKNFETTEIKLPNLDSEQWVSYEIDEENSLGIFKLNRCRYNEEYFNTLLNFYKEVSNKKIKNIAIDLRKNVGGNSAVVRLFALGLKKLEKFCSFGACVRDGNKILKRDSVVIDKNDIEEFRTYYLGENYDKNILFDGNVFLLTSHATFSSGLWFATIFSDNNLAKVVGEIPGNSPESFGDTSGKVFCTPNSKLKFCTTFKKFYRPDKSKDGTRLIPDVQVPAKDALNKVYEIIKNNK